MKPPIRPPDRNAPRVQDVVTVVRISDPTAIGDSIELLDQDVISLGTEKFETKRVIVPFAECCLMYQWTSASLRTLTHIHEDFDACTILGPQSRGSLDGVTLHPYSMMMAGPGGHGEIIVDRNYESVSLLVPPKVLEEHLTLRGQTIGQAIPDCAEVWRPTTDSAKENFELGLRIIETAEKTPELFNNNRWARQGAQVEFIDSLLGTIESCGVDEPLDTNKKGKSYSQIVKTCEEFTLQHDERRPYLSELCAAAHVSERTLQYAFKDILGMSPLTYLHRLRLHRARDDLRKAEKSTTTVTDIAIRWGFWHFGEFSRSYKNCFGEVPSLTLKQSQ
jgi:AraC family ethanolamine operon transcriptional activator